MSQEEMSKLLHSVYPEYVDYHYIMDNLNINRRSVYSNLMKLVKRNEVEFIIVISDRTNTFIRKYREKKC